MTEEKKTKGSQMRFDENELALIKATFKGREDLLKLMRKVFLPELDPTAPLGQMIDLWLSIPTAGRKPEEIAIDLQARNMLITHLDLMLMQLQVLAESKEETAAETAQRLLKNSSK